MATVSNVDVEKTDSDEIHEFLRAVTSIVVTILYTMYAVRKTTSITALIGDSKRLRF